MDPVTIIEGGVTDLPRDNVDTDQIIPARYMKRVERTGFGEFLFHEWRQNGLDLPVNPILVAGDNFGCGSSREHAPWALGDYGFRAIISPRFADIFRNNCLKVGLVPVELPQDVVTRIMRIVEDDSSVEIVVDVVDRRVAVPAIDLDEPFDLDDHTRHRLLHGLDDIGLTLERGDEIAGYEAGRPRWLPKVPTTS
jgi:3-isopropylmalate/(R)-2-methylmalate dehydratase small subunit